MLARGGRVRRPWAWPWRCFEGATRLHDAFDQLECHPGRFDTIHMSPAGLRFPERGSQVQGFPGWVDVQGGLEHHAAAFEDAECLRPGPVRTVTDHAAAVEQLGLGSGFQALLIPLDGPAEIRPDFTLMALGQHAPDVAVPEPFPVGDRPDLVEIAQELAPVQVYGGLTGGAGGQK